MLADSAAQNQSASHHAHHAGPLPTVVPNIMQSWWPEILKCSCPPEEWLPCCDPHPCADRLPLPPLSFGSLRSREFVAYHVSPCRRVGLRQWRERRFAARSDVFEDALPTHPAFGWYLVTFLEKVVAKQFYGNSGFAAEAPGALSSDVDWHLGYLCVALLQMAGAPKTGKEGYRQQDFLRDPQGPVAHFEHLLMVNGGLRWAVPVRYHWEGCIFGAIADFAALATSGRLAALNGSTASGCSAYREAQWLLKAAHLAVASGGALEELVVGGLLGAVNEAQDMAFTCPAIGGAGADDATRRAGWLLGAQGLFATVGNLGRPLWAASTAGFRLAPCGGQAAAVPRFPLAGGAVTALLLGASVVAGAVELALFLKPNNGCIPLADKVVALSLPHVALLAWRCVFGGGGNATSESPGPEPGEPATVLAYYGTEAVVRCRLPRAWAPGAPLELSLRPGNPEAERAGWALEGLRLCPRLPVKRRRLALCSQPMYGMAGREDHLVEWLEYHRQEAGVEHFFLYDNDGSLAEPARPYVAAGLASYFGRWPRHFGEDMDALHRLGAHAARPVGEDAKPQRYPSALSSQAETHCLFRTRYEADYTIFIHSVDAYLSWPGDEGGLSGLLKRLDPMRPELAAISVPYVPMGGPPQPGPRLVIERFGLRSDRRLLIWDEPGAAEEEVEAWLDAAQPLVVPENVVAIVGSHWARGRPGTIHVEADRMEARIFHYVDLLGPRCVGCAVPDASMLPAAGRLRRRLRGRGAKG